MKLKKKDDDEEKMAFLAKGPSMYYVSTFLDFFVPSTHYVSINTFNWTSENITIFWTYPRVLLRT